MKPWIRTALAVVLVLAIAAGGVFLPDFGFWGPRRRQTGAGVFLLNRAGPRAAPRFGPLAARRPATHV